MTYVVYILIAIYAIIYLRQIVNGVSEIRNVNYLINTINQVIEELDRANDHNNNHMPDYNFKYNVRPIRELMIKEMPRINKVLPYSFSNLSLNQSDETLESNFKSIVSQISAKNDKLNYQQFKFLNPLNALKKLFLLPSEIISWFGINLTTFPGRIFSLVIWIASIFAQESISRFLSLIIDNFLKGKK